jgi:hypothetical protein
LKQKRFAGSNQDEDYLREIQGPMLDHREDRARWLAWMET